jgi:hypothetical protein
MKASYSHWVHLFFIHTSRRRILFSLLIAVFIQLGAAFGQNYDPFPYKFPTLAGVSPRESEQNIDGFDKEARFNRPNNVVADSIGNIYVVGRTNAGGGFMGTVPVV